MAEVLAPQGPPVELGARAGLVQMAPKEVKARLHAPLPQHLVMQGWAQMGRLRLSAQIQLDHSVVVVVVEAAGKPTTRAPVFGVYLEVLAAVVEDRTTN